MPQCNVIQKVKKTSGHACAQGQGEEEPVIKEEPEEEPNEVVQEEDEDKPSAKAYYRFNSKLATAPQVAPEEVPKIKALPHRSGKQAQLQHMAVAFAKSGWGHNLFKSIEQLEMHRAQQNKAKAYPRQVMVTKCGGEEGFAQALCGNEIEEVENPEDPNAPFMGRCTTGCCVELGNRTHIGTYFNATLFFIRVPISLQQENVVFSFKFATV